MVMQPAARTAKPAAAPPPAEHEAWSIPGSLALVLGLPALIVGIGLLVSALTKSKSPGSGAAALWATLLLVVGALILSGLVQVVAGEARVVQLFGRYRARCAPRGWRS